MPLTPAKSQHIKDKLRQILLGRTQLVSLTCRNADGSNRVVGVNAVWRVQEDNDPTYDPGGGGADEWKGADVVALFLLADIDYPTMRSCVYAELAAGQSGPQVATRYLPTGIQVKGIAAGGDRLVVAFDRQR